MAWFTATISTNKVGSDMSVDFEIPDVELDGLTEEQRDNRIGADGWDAATERLGFSVKPKEN